MHSIKFILCNLSGCFVVVQLYCHKEAVKLRQRICKASKTCEETFCFLFCAAGKTSKIKVGNLIVEKSNISDYFKSNSYYIVVTVPDQLSYPGHGCKIT